MPRRVDRHSRSDTAETLVGGRYRIENELARGGMGVVFAAMDEVNGTRVALKRLLPNQVGALLPELFAREYYTLARLRHPHIIEVYDYGSDEHGPFYTMELLDGRDLSDASPLPYRQACAHLRDVASSLSLLHAHRLVHRDLSARNVRLTTDGHAKLLDFGALAHFGVATELVGTPSFVAPEALRGASLDHRADLFGLGALAYWTLTGRHAYSAETFEALRLAFRRPCVPPSQIVADIPAELDALVMSLLALDPLVRPMSAAEVIDRLVVIARLPNESPQAVARSYLLSAKFVGRSRELERLCGHLQQTLRGEGGAVMIEAAEGLGRTRLAGELLLQAQLLGVPAALVESGLHSGSYSTVAALVRATSARLPQTRAVFEKRADMLPEAVRGLLAQGHPLVPAVVPADPLTDRDRVRGALRECFMDLVQMTPLLLVVDDLHRADEDSRAVIALLAHAAPQQRLALVLTSPPVVVVSHAAEAFAVDRITLTELGWPDMEALIGSLFGTAQHAGRCAKRLHEVTHGNPKESMELAQHLVDCGVVRYVQGAWVLPQELSEQDLPRSSTEALMTRLHGLSADARHVADTLSIHRCPIELQLCLELMGELETDRSHRALDELITHGVLRARASSYEFTHRELREQLVEELQPQRRIELHQTLGRRLARDGSQDAEYGLEAGYHLLQGGQSRIGADLLVRSAQRLLADLRGVYLAADSLAIAYEMYKTHDRTVYERLRVGALLIIASYFVDPHYGHRYGKEVFELALQATGCDVGATNSALGVEQSVERARASHAAAYAAAISEGRQGSMPTFEECFVALLQVTTSWTGILLATQGAAGLPYLVETLQPAAEALGDTYGLRYVHSDCLRVLATARGEFATSYLLMQQARAWLDRGNLPPILAEARIKLLAGNIFATGLFTAFRDGDTACHHAAALERLGHPFFVAQAAYVRLLYHLLRGESGLAAGYRDQFERYAIGGVATWQFEAAYPIAFAAVYHLTGDVVGLANVVEGYARLVERMPELSAPYETARAYLHLQRGELEQALLAVERVDADHSALYWFHVVAHATALNRLRRHARAAEVCRRARDRETDDAYVQSTPFRVAATCQLAIAEASVGDMIEAQHVMDAALLQFRNATNPLIIGMLQETRAQLAERSSDAAGIAKHVALAQAAFRSTGNPTLIARAQRLATQVRDSVSHMAQACGSLVTIDGCHEAAPPTREVAS